MYLSYCSFFQNQELFQNLLMGRIASHILQPPTLSSSNLLGPGLFLFCILKSLSLHLNQSHCLVISHSSTSFYGTSDLLHVHVTVHIHFPQLPPLVLNLLFAVTATYSQVHDHYLFIPFIKPSTSQIPLTSLIV